MADLKKPTADLTPFVFKPDPPEPLYLPGLAWRKFSGIVLVSTLYEPIKGG
jgi:hypothetical protein